MCVYEGVEMIAVFTHLSGRTVLWPHLPLVSGADDWGVGCWEVYTGREIVWGPFPAWPPAVHAGYVSGMCLRLYMFL